jgi:hypothetical protein
MALTLVGVTERSPTQHHTNEAGIEESKRQLNTR